MKLRRLISFGAVISMLLVGCQTPDVEVKEMVENKTDAIEIGMCFDSFIIERWQRDQDAFVAKASKDLGAEVNIQSANGDTEEQAKQIEYLIEEGVDVIVVIAIDSEAIGDAVQKAKRAGIKVIAYDRLIYNSNVDLYISFDNLRVGELMAESILSNTREGEDLLMVCGPTADNNVSLVMEGFNSIIENSNRKIIGVEHAEGWIAEKGFEAVNTYLEEGKSLSAVMCGNDDIASQVIKALSERRLAGDVCVVGQDADLGACQRIVEGTQTMTVYKPIEKLARLAAEYAVKLANNEVIEYEDTMYDGAYEVPYVGLEPLAVTKENINVIIEDGYHMEEEVYLNVK